MKKLLIITDWFEPGFKAGGPIRSCVNLARSLQGKMEVLVLTSDRDVGDSEPYAGIRCNEWIHKPNAYSVYYASPDQQSTRALHTIIRDCAPDTVYLNSMYSVPFTIRPFFCFEPEN